MKQNPQKSLLKNQNHSAILPGQGHGFKSMNSFKKWTHDQMNLPPIVDEISFIKAESKIQQKQQLGEKKIQEITLFITIHFDEKSEKTLELIADDDAKISEIKEFIADLIVDKVQVYANQISIQYNKENLKNNSTLRSNAIKNNSHLNVWLEMEKIIHIFVIVSVEIVKVEYQFKIDNEAPINIFLNGVRDYINEQGAAEKYQLKFYFGNMEIQMNDSRTLQELDVKNGSVIKGKMIPQAGCFPNFAPILLLDGTEKKICDVKIGDKVMAYDIQNGQFTPSQIVALHQSIVNTITVIQTKNVVITTTPNHPFWTEQGWKAVEPNPLFGIKELSIEDKILDRENQFTQIVSIRNIRENEVTVYNITTQKPNSYVAFGFVVHNMTMIKLKINGEEKFEEIYPDMLIYNIKVKIQINYGISIEQQELFFEGRQLEDHETLSEYISFGKQVFTIELKIKQQTTFKDQKNEQIAILRLIENTSQVQIKILKEKNLSDLFALLDVLKKKSEDEQLKILYNGLVLDRFMATPNNFCLRDNQPVILLRENEVLSSFQFFSFLQEVKLENLGQLTESLSLLENQDQLLYFIQTVVDEIKNDKSKQSDYQQYQLHHLVAIKLWTSNLLYKQINIDLRSNKFDIWKGYLKCLLEAVRYCSYYKGTTFRGISNYLNTELYQMGKSVQWSEVSCSSKEISIASQFANKKGMLFELELISAKDIERLSIFEYEREVLMLPFSNFIVTSVETPKDKPAHVKLKEQPLPRSQYILLWIDDNPENNFCYTQLLEMEKPQISVVFCLSTKEAINVIEKYKWMILLDDQNLRIVSDMVRYEEGAWDYTAGIKFISHLYEKMQYDYEVLIFCGDVQRATDNCQKLNIVGNYAISNSEDVLQSFIRFE